MPVSFKIFPELNLVYVRYSGTALMDETAQAFGQYMQHPDCRLGQKQLVDFSGVTEFDADFPKLMQLQAQKADLFAQGPVETLVVYYAPNEMTLRMARMAERSWEGIPGLVAMVAEEEEQALTLLGRSDLRMAQLRAQSA